MIKVLNVTSDHNIGGAGRCILTFLDCYDRRKFDVKIVLPRGSALIPYVEKTNTAYIEADGMQDISYSKEGAAALSEIFRQERPDLVHTHASFSARIAAKKKHIPVIYTRHSVFPNKPSVTKGIGKLVNGLANSLTADKIIAVAQAAKDNLTESGVPAKKIVVVKNGVKALVKYDALKTAQAREFFGILPGDFVFAMIARLEAVKGHAYFIEAAREVHEQYPNTKFLICGTGSQKEILQEKAVRAGLKDVVIFTGHLQDVTAVMNALDVNVNASYGTEATSLSLLEGMSLGKPIIASDYGGNPELVIPGKNGLLFSARSSSELKKRMLEILKDRTLYEKLSAGACQLYNQQYTAEHMTRQIEKIYEETVEGKRR